MTDHELTVIAEAGVNHNGDLGRALEMIDAAAATGADMIKFQLFRTDALVVRGTQTASYQATNTGQADQAELLAALELDRQAFECIAERCRERDVGFLCTAFDTEAIGSLIDHGMPCIKVASGELTNTPALKSFGSFGVPVLLSTGMATLDEVKLAVDTLRSAGSAQVTVLHCTSLYPAPMETINLRAMTTMGDALGIPIGYSDHSLGDHVAVAAAALGATVVEKHFTLDRDLPGPDHKSSLTPDEFAAMVRKMRDIGSALGDGIKRPAPGEAETAAVVRRSWHAARDLEAGAVLAERDLTLKRPADGLAPADCPVGRTLAVARPFDAPVGAEHLR